VSKIARSPIPDQPRNVLEDAIVHREFALTGEALHMFLLYAADCWDRKVQEVTQGRPKRCEVADDSVLVLKSRPVKAGNSVEGKIGMTRRPVRLELTCANSYVSCEGMKFI
jgi:hypothetical protein